MVVSIVVATGWAAAVRAAAASAAADWAAAAAASLCAVTAASCAASRWLASAAAANASASAATYFLSVDLTASGISLDDVSFANKLIDEAGVASIPVSAFYAEDAVNNVLRFCFVKEDATLDAAIARIAEARDRLAG